MVKLSLVSPRGNQGVRYFPYQGYLGLTPLRFDGLVRTQIEQDGKPILAKDLAVAVRCYESRQGRLGSTHTTVLYEHALPLWHKPDAHDWSELGDAEFPFRFSLPPHIPAPSTALYSQEYRIFWRIEAVLNHIPISAVGSRQVKHFELPLARYDAPSTLSPPTPLSPSSSSGMTLLRSKSRRPSLRYHLLVPSNPIGPLDIVTVQLIVQPLDPSASIRSASALVERRIHFNDLRSSPPNSPPGPYRFSPQNHGQDNASCLESTRSSAQDLLHPPASSSVCSIDSSQPLLQNRECSTDDAAPHSSAGRGTTHIIAHAESVGRFSRDQSGFWRQNLTFSWPDTKSNSRWAVGESVQTGSATVKFFLRVKLIVSSLASSAETVELEDKELAIVSTNDLQRRLAFSRYNDSVNTTSERRPKSESPRRSKRDRPQEQLPSPPRSPRQTPVSEESSTLTPLTKPPFLAAHTYKISTASSPYPEGSSSSSKSKVSRRPHTSAGSRLDTRTYENSQRQGGRLVVPPRPETAHPMHFSKSPWSSRSFIRQKSVEPSRLGSSSSMSSGGHLTVESSQHHSHGSLLFEKANQVDVQAWEQELARIESLSRRNSADMLGFWSQRKKAGVEQPSIPTYLHAEG